ncbi:MAG: hypothetical protein O2923_13405, partial [Verrucomicrobia bacterium]|nr:hypothetical protein [Verrucomicrobiota bacterium]
ELIDVVDFFISPNYSLVTPNGGETNIYALKPQGVIWNTLGGPIQSDIYYSLDPGRDPSSWVKINPAAIDDSGNSATVPGINVFPNWTPPNVISASAWLRVQHAAFTNMFAADFEGPFDDTDDPFSILYFTILWHVMDAATSNDLDRLSVIDSSGWSESGLTGDVFNVSGKDIHLIARSYPFGTFDTEWSREFFFNEVIFRWKSQPSRILDVFMTPSEIEPNYEVRADFNFDTVTRRFNIQSWLERGGVLLQTPDSSTVTVYDDGGSILETITSSTPVQGFFLQEWDVAQTETDLATTFDSSDIFPAKVSIDFAGVTYSAGVTFQLRLSAAAELEGVIAAATSNILAAVEGVDTNVLGVASNVSDLSSQVAAGFAGVQATLEGLSNQVDAITGSTTGLTASLQASLDFLTNEAVTVWTPSLTNLVQDVAIISDDVRSDLAHILNRSTTVQLGETVDILYKTRSGYSGVTIAVTNDGAGQVYGGTMAEIGTTGIYEDQVTFNFGEGVFQVICTDQLESDRIIISVVTTNDPFVISIGQLSNQLANIEAVVTNLGADFALLDIMTGQLASLSTTVSNIDITVAQNLADLKIDMSNVVAATADLTNQLAGLEGLAGITGQLDLFAELGSNLAQVAQSGLLGLATSVSNIDLKTQFLTNDLAQLSFAASNLNAKADITTNSLTGLQAIPGLTGTLAQIEFFTSNLQLLLDSNIDELGTNISDILGMTRGLTNEIQALASATGQLDAVIGLASNVQSITQTGFSDVQFSLSNLQAAINFSTNQLSGLEGLTGLTGSLGTLGQLVTNLDIIIDSGIGGLATEISNLVVKTDIVTNQLDGLQGLAGITAKLDVIENLTSNLNEVLDIGLLTFAASVSNIEIHTTLLTNLMQSLGVVTGDLDSLTLLVESNIQLFADTGLGTLGTSISNIDARTILITGAVANLDVSISTISNQLSGLEGLAGITNVDFSVLGGLSSNLQSLIDSGIVGLAESVSNIALGVEQTTNQLAGLSALDTLNSNIQDLLATGIGDLAGAISNIDDKADITTNQLAILGSLTNLDLSALGGITSNLQSLVDSGLVDLASLVSNIAVGVELATNQLSGLDQLSDLSNVVVVVGDLNSNLQDLLATGVGDLAGNVSNLLAIGEATTNQLEDLADALGVTGALDGITDVLSNLNALASGELTGLASNLATLVEQTSDLTNQITGLSELSTLPEAVSNATSALAAIALAVSNSTTSLDGAIDSVTNIEAAIAGADFTALTTIATLAVDITAIREVTSEITWGDVGTILTELTTQGADITALTEQGATNEELIRGTSNLVAVLEARLGVEGDEAGVGTVFGRLAALDAALAVVGTDAAQARKDVRTAKTSASAASAGINLLKQAIGSADVETAIGLFDQMAQNIEDIVENVRNIERGIAQGALLEKVADIGKQLEKIAKDAELDPGQIGITELNETITAQKKDIMTLQNSIEQLQGAMLLMQKLLDKGVNKPVITTLILSGT